MSRTPAIDDNAMRWFVMRDLGRKSIDPTDHRRKSAWEIARDGGHDVFVPTAQREIIRGGRRRVEVLPVVPDLVFLHDTYARALALTERRIGLTFRYVKGGAYCEPMTVADRQMEQFVQACRAAVAREYYTSAQLTELSLGRMVRVVNGPLEGIEGRLLKIRGVRRKRIFLGIDGILFGSFVIDEQAQPAETWYEFLD